jgi:membrane protein
VAPLMRFSGASGVRSAAERFGGQMGQAATQSDDTANGVARAKREVKKATSFYAKVSEDWMLNFSGMLAYNYLTAIAPILLAVLAIAGLIVGSLSPEAYHSFVVALGSRFPGGAGHSLVTGGMAELRRSAGILLAIAIITAIFSGSRLFVALDNVFAVIFRVDVRPFLKQNTMAILMMLLFLVLAPLSFFASSVPAFVLSYVLPSGIQSNGFVLTVEGFIGGVIVAFILFAAIYYVVPNIQQRWATTWPGALATAVLLNLFELLFPIYQRIFLKNAGLGSAAGLAIVILIFLYYIGVITLLGAEINAWVSGLRPLSATLPQLYRNQRQAGNGNAPGSRAEEATQAERAAQAAHAQSPDSPARSLVSRLAALRRPAPRQPTDDHALPST